MRRAWPIYAAEYLQKREESVKSAESRHLKSGANSTILNTSPKAALIQKPIAAGFAENATPITIKERVEVARIRRQSDYGVTAKELEFLLRVL